MNSQTIYAPAVREKCAVFGVYGPGLDAARLTYFGLYALQHRGQEASGIVSSDGVRFYEHKGDGLVAQVYTEDAISSLTGAIAIGHNRYSTSGGTGAAHCQPVVPNMDLVALAHNGNLPDTTQLELFLGKVGIPTEGLTDSELMAAAIAHYVGKGLSLKKSLKICYPLFTGAFSLLVMTKNEMAALRYPPTLHRQPEWRLYSLV